jgi:methionine aminotransferase
MNRSKVSHIGESIFPMMTRLCNEHNAINLSQGFPDFPIDPELKELVAKYVNEDKNQYAPADGVVHFREVLAKKYEDCYNVKVDPIAEITVHTGAAEGLFNSIAAIIDEGDEAIIFEPAYDSYAPVIEYFKGKVVPIKLELPNFSINWNKVKDRITEKTRLIIINSPHNPTGTLLEDIDFKNLIEITKNKDIYIISDEVYEHIIFDGKKHITILQYPELREKSIAVFSLGKTLHTTGWRLGYTIAAKDITEDIRKYHQFNSYTCITPIQWAVADYLSNKENYLYLSEFFEKKRDNFYNLLKQTKLEVFPSYGSYFMIASYKHLSDMDDLSFATHLIKEYGVGTIPISFFYKDRTDNKIIRFCFAKKDEILYEAANRLMKL